MPDTPDTRDAPYDPLAALDPWIALEDGRFQLLRSLDPVDDARSATVVYADEGEGDGEGWTIADILSHIASWDEMHAECFEALAAGQREFAQNASPDDDWSGWNAGRVAAAGGQSFDERVARLHASRDRMLQTAAAVPQDMMLTDVTPPWGFTDSVTGFLVAQAAHDGLHAEAIRVALAANAH